MVMRPKSIATVVVVLPPGSPSSGSTVLAACVIQARCSPGISETAPTRVVLPTPNPPAITILAEARDCGGRSGELA